MTPGQVIDTLQANLGKRIRITFDDGLIQTVIVSSVDDEGFLHSGPDCADPQGFWTRFESVARVEPEA